MNGKTVCASRGKRRAAGRLRQRLLGILVEMNILTKTISKLRGKVMIILKMAMAMEMEMEMEVEMVMRM